MKNLIYVPAVLAVLATPLFAQQNDSEAQEILKGVSQKYKSLTTISADFTYQLEDAQNKTAEKQTGKVFLKGTKYLLQIPSQEVFCDGQTVWTYLKDSKEVQITDPDAKEDAITPANIFTMYERGFTFKYIEESAQGETAVQIIDLTPIDKTKKYFKVRLTINKAEKLIISSTLFDKNGNKISYFIDKFTPDNTLDDSIFTFTIANYPGIEVVDLR